MKITNEKIKEWLKICCSPEAIKIEILVCLNNTIDEAQEKICESIDTFVNAKVASDKVIEGVLKDIRASIDDAAKKES